MLHGSFIENSQDMHVDLRRNLLDGSVALAPPAETPIPLRASESADAIVSTLAGPLRDRGLAVGQLDRPLPNERFVALGSRLGKLMPETDPAVQPYVELDVILNLITKRARTSDGALQPFAGNPLSLHTESSGRSAAEQPRFIVLMCCDPGEAALTAQTVLVPMATVKGRLAPETTAILERTRYRASKRGPTIARQVDRRHIFSFRDFLSQTLDWTHVGSETGPTEVNGAIRELLTSMYRPAGTSGLRWARGMIVIIDNTFFFHGRTAGPAVAVQRPRHLRRLRIV